MKKNRIRTVIIALCGLVFCFSIYQIVSILVTREQENAEFEALAALVEQEAPSSVNEPELSGEEDGEAQGEGELKNLDELFQQNPDMCGWLRIPDTKLNYPVMYTPKEIERYLRRSFDGKPSVSGTPFVGEGCGPDDDCFIVYGHKMKNGTMFGILDSYEDRDFWESHKTLTFDTAEEHREYEVFSAFYTRIFKPSEEGFRYYNTVGNLDAETFNSLVQQFQASSAYDTGLTPKPGTQLLILSTCSYHVKDGRFVVAAYRTK